MHRELIKNSSRNDDLIHRSAFVLQPELVFTSLHHLMDSEWLWEVYPVQFLVSTTVGVGSPPQVPRSQFFLPLGDGPRTDFQRLDDRLVGHLRIRKAKELFTCSPGPVSHTSSDGIDWFQARIFCLVIKNSRFCFPDCPGKMDCRFSVESPSFPPKRWSFEAIRSGKRNKFVSRGSFQINWKMVFRTTSFGNLTR